MSEIQHVTEALELQNNLVKRFSKIAKNSTKLMTQKPKSIRLKELNELNEAYNARIQELTKTWAEEWSQWYNFANSISGAKTFPKFAERYSNIGLQAQEQLAKQVTDMSELFENTTVSYSYWLSKQVESVDD